MVKSFLLANTILRSQRASLPRTFCRYKSITAAIERGRGHVSRDARIGRERSEGGDSFESRRGAAQHYIQSRRHARDDGRPPRRGGMAERRSSAQQAGDAPRHVDPKPSGNGRVGEEHSGQRHRESTTSSPPSQRVPETLPYSTAASEFLYGHSSVLASLKAGRRKFYKLYVHVRGLNHAGRDVIVRYARKNSLSIQEVGDEYLRALDKASGGRPHNGFVLEASPLPVPPITELGISSIEAQRFELGLGSQSAEDVEINGKNTWCAYNSAGWRHPLVLYVDGVLDEGNLGATARSAYFLGVDAIVTPARQSAPWSHITLKASAGAAEAIPIFNVSQPTDFLGRSARAGWRIYASDVIPSLEQRAHSTSAPGAAPVADFASSVIFTYAKHPRRLSADHCPVESHPTILMMGAESTGLRPSLLNVAHFKVGIRHGRNVDEVGVDSLNVSVAASLLCFEMLKKPRPKRNLGELLF